MMMAMARGAPQTNSAKNMISYTNNVYGGAVNIASRISGLSAPGEVLVSDTIPRARPHLRRSAVRGPRRARAGDSLGASHVWGRGRDNDAVFRPRLG